MHNWYLALLEHIGVLTHEEAKKLSEEIRLRIHKENYVEAFREVEAILGKDNPLKQFKKLEQDLKLLQAKIAELDAKLVTSKPEVKKVA